MKVENLEIPDGIKQDFIEEGITDLNPPQRDAVDAGLMDGEDMVVASPTASGKTFIAELAMVNQVKKNDKKAVYIVPLKALASEKYQDFSERYSDLDVRMSVGDYDDSGTGLETADIIVATSEKLDSMLRHNPSWIHEIGLVVVDEIHLLTSPERGPTLEVTISRLRDIIGTGSSTDSPAFQMLGLSATISNSYELADWLDAELVESDYRPVELKHGIYHGNEVEFYPEDVEKEDIGAGVEGSDLEPEEDSPFSTGNEVKDEEKDEIESHTYFVDDRHGRGTLNLIEDTLQLEKQCIIFCSSRKGSEKSSDRATGPTGEDLSREERKELEDYADRIESVLGSPTSQCERLAENIRKGAAFHHAGLLPEQRSLVEEAFRDGLVRTVSATPTLAAGVNLPAFRVIIRDLKRYTGRGMEYIPVLEYEQMTGRAGRPRYDDRGEAISIAKSGDKDEILERYIAGEPERIQSKLNAEPVLRMHTLSLVASRFCTSMPDLKEFYKKTFYAHQFSSVDGLEEVERTVEEVVEQLREYGFLESDDMKATEVGKRVSELYIDPDSAHHILETLEKSGDRDTRPITFLFMLARTSEMTPRLRVKDDEYSDIAQELVDAEEYILEEVPEEWEPRYDHFLECMKTSMMMQGWMSELDEERLMEKYGIAPGGIRAKMQNADWLLYAAKELARMEGVKGDVEKELERVRLRLKHGIEEELLALVKYDQIGRVRARKLYDHGVRSREDIRETSFEKLKKLIGKRTAEKLKKQVGQENIFDRENVLDYFE
ncbi:MAG: DEAD/DEAH box helicase [Candidatus Nanohaloarchaea archaeon]